MQPRSINMPPSLGNPAEHASALYNRAPRPAVSDMCLLLFPFLQPCWHWNMLGARALSRRVAVGAVASLLVFTLFASDAQAQLSNVGGTLEGIVTDSSGALVPGATVTVVNTQTNQTRSLIADDRGFFRASQLP